MQYEKPILLLLCWFCCLTLSTTQTSETEEAKERLARAKAGGSKPKGKGNKSDKDNGDFLPDGTKKTKMSEQDIIQRVLKVYDWRVRPYGMNESAGDTGGPVLVEVNFLLRSISKIDDVNMEYSAQFTFREQWQDPRLAYEQLFSGKEFPDFVVLATGDQSQQVWMPDTFFQNEKEARKHNIDKPNVLIRIHSNGKILYSVRLTLTLSCPMTLQYYPLDRQTCLIDLSSYAYTTDDIIYVWKDTNPVQLKAGLRKSLPSFDLVDVATGYCTSKTNTGEYSCLQTKLILRREFSYYLLQLYIPSFMLVIVSWVSFWLDKDSVPARVTLGVTTLLTMTTQSSGINAKLPPVSYTKAIDVWIGVCLAFIFGALLEFALVNYAARRDILDPSARRGRRGHFAPPPDPNPLEPAEFNMNSVLCHNPGDLQTVRSSRQQSQRRRRRKKGCLTVLMSKYNQRSKRIDVVSRLLFPVGFFVFNCVYWTIYMI